jgi:MFS family permease
MSTEPAQAAPTSAEAADARRVRGNVLRLAVAQALAGANASVIFATGSIIGSMLAPDPALATVPLSVFVVGMACGTLPTGWIARTRGRRAAFMMGTGCGIITGLVAAIAVLIGSFGLFCVATLFGGLYASVVQSFRFAAADGATAAFRPRALSWVMAGGVFAGVIGPQLVTWTMDLWQPYLFAVSYLAQAAVALIAMLVLSGVDVPKPKPADSAGGRKLLAIIRQPRFIAAATCGIVAQSLMNLVMTSAPLAMRMCDLPIVSSNWAIQWHIVAMYGPSFFTGTLISKFGASRVVVAGLAITVGAAFMGLSGITETHFFLALILLGLGWNFGFVGASAMVLETHTGQERTRVQSFNDFLVFGITALGSFSSGQLLAFHGWHAVNYVVFPAVAIACLVLLASGALRRAPATA